MKVSVARTTTGCPSIASGKPRKAKLVAVEKSSVLPTPSFLEIHPTAITPITKASPHGAPITPTRKGERWRTLYANSRQTAPKIEDPRFEVPVQPAILDRIGFFVTTRIPSFISEKKVDLLARFPSPFTTSSSPPAPNLLLLSGFSSLFLIEVREKAETRYPAASTIIERAAPKRVIMNPASGGPNTEAAAWLVWSFWLPSIKSDLSTRTGR